MLYPRPQAACTRTILVMLMCMAACAADLGAAEYYVDYAAGLDANDGNSPTTPWKHCAGDPAATDVPATAVLSAGDTVHFKGGVTYVFTGATGIRLGWDGRPDAPIIYDGNVFASWGEGRARFTDNRGGNRIAAFSSDGPRANLIFRGLEIAGIGGSEMLPADGGTPVVARPGRGIVFADRATNISIEACVFRELGYWYNARPMSAASLDGTAVEFGACEGLAILSCEFERMKTAIKSSALPGGEGLEVFDCRFGEAIVWPLDVPVNAGAVRVLRCTFAEESRFAATGWIGYGDNPYTDTQPAIRGAMVEFSAAALGTPSPTFQWQKDGAPIPGATDARFSIKAVTDADAGSYSVVATNEAGSSTSNRIVLQVVAPPPPVIVMQPVAQTAAVGEGATFSVVASKLPSLTFRWQKDGVDLPGANEATLTIGTVNAADAGMYTVIVSGPGGTVTSSAVELTVRDAGRLINVSVRAMVGRGSSGLTLGFVLDGAGEKSLLLRGIGPALRAYGLADALDDPRLTLLTDSQPIAANDDWFANDSANDVAAMAGKVGAFALAESSRDAALVARLSGGAFSAEVAAKSDATGVALLEMYDGTPDSPVRFVNVSARARLGAGAPAASLGFVVSGGSRKLLIRAVGPTLAGFKVGDVLDDPTLALFEDNAPLLKNHDWGGDPALAEAAVQVGAFPLAGADTKDAAVLVTLASGSYSAVVSGAEGTGGVVLLEIYDVP
jgi:hypothetical protein